MERNRYGLIPVVITTAMVTFIISALAFSALNYLRPNGVFFDPRTVSAEEIKKFNQVRSILKSEYYENVDETTMLEGAIAGMTAALGDRYTAYYSKEQWKRLQEDIEGEFTGIGVLLKADSEGTVIAKVFDGSPAQSAGVQKGDKIIKIDGKDVSKENVTGISRIIKSRKDPKVSLTVYRPSKEENIDFVIELRTIKEENISSRLIDGGIGYIKIDEFDAGVADEFEKNLSKLLKKDIKGLIIDVRDDPGGYYEQVVKIADRLLPKCTIVYTEDKYKVRDIKNSNAKELGLPMTLLVNGNSASASEILAGAIKDNKYGKLVGTKTYGKGLVQRPVTFPDGSGMKVTVQRYFTPSGVCIQDKGIQPDFEIKLDKKYDSIPVSEVPVEDDLQLKKAIEILREEIN